MIIQKKRRVVFSAFPSIVRLAKKWSVNGIGDSNLIWPTVVVRTRAILERRAIVRRSSSNLIQ